MRRSSFFFTAMWLGCSGFAHGATSPEPPTILEADQVDIDDKKGISTYTGSVKLTRGTLTLLSDKLVVHRTKQELQKAIATGNPARLHQAAEGDRKEVRGEGKRVEYDPKSGEILLQEQAILHQERDEFSGEQIRYNVNDETVNASKGTGGESRVRVVIHPKQDAKPAP